MRKREPKKKIPESNNYNNDVSGIWLDSKCSCNRYGQRDDWSCRCRCFIHSVRMSFCARKREYDSREEEKNGVKNFLTQNMNDNRTKRKIFCTRNIQFQKHHCSSGYFICHCHIEHVNFHSFEQLLLVCRSTIIQRRAH